MEPTSKSILRLYEKKAHLYDLDNTSFFFGKKLLRKSLLSCLDEVTSGNLVLDAGAGTGDMSIQLSKDVGGKIVSADFSISMLKIAKRKIKERELSNVNLVRCDVTRLPFRESIFSLVTCSCFLDTVSDPRKAASELFRVLIPSGYIGSAHFSKPKSAFVEVLDRVIETFWWMGWRCRNVDIGRIFSKIGFRNVKDFHFYNGITTVTVAQKL